jgi:hypothetical protein
MKSHGASLTVIGNLKAEFYVLNEMIKYAVRLKEGLKANVCTTVLALIKGLPRGETAGRCDGASIS